MLHRNISTGNILIDIESPPGEPRGLLADWDLCKYKIQMNDLPTQPGGRSVSCIAGRSVMLSLIALYDKSWNLAFPVCSRTAIPTKANRPCGRFGVVHLYFGVLRPSVSPA